MRPEGHYKVIKISPTQGLAVLDNKSMMKAIIFIIMVNAGRTRKTVPMANQNG